MIKTKRDSLERFINEQVLGPGVSGFRFLDVTDSLLEKDVSTLSPIEYTNEIINIVPAGVYSTGILFPVDKSKAMPGSTLSNPHEKEVLEDEEISKEKDEDSIEENDSIQIDQMYPNTMGMTCCLNESVYGSEIKVNVRARYYQKMDHKVEDYAQRYGVLCECDLDKLKSVLANTQLLTSLVFFEKNNNKIVTIKELKPDQISELRSEIRKMTERKTEEFQGLLQEFNFQLRAKSLSALKQSCYYELKKNCVDSAKREKLYSISQDIEVIENIAAHLNDLVDLQDSRSYGLWQSKPINVDVNLPGKISKASDGKQIFSYKDKKYSAQRDIFKYDIGEGRFASLSVNFQISSDSRKNDGKVFLKVQLVNTSTPFEKEEGDSRYYSTFNEEVNIRTFFGVSLQISNDHLIPYNEVSATQNKDKFSEDDTTRFLYRQFSDYAIGHGCSVKWSTSAGNIVVQTEYIPTCETPDVDPIPRNKEILRKTGNVWEPAYFLESSKALEFKWLSLFSGTSDTEILKGLIDFIDSYGKWIGIKRGKYSSEQEGTKRIVTQELDKCEADKNRMVLNIETFLRGKENERNLHSFRLMNSAMFMQLWHSAHVKNDNVKHSFESSSFSSFDFDFYRDASDKIFSEKISAAWRPFQLAFILLNLDGIFRVPNDAKWVMRNNFVDLVWFPTGGGKTEAYLGIIALTIINRRSLHGERGGGTAAIMRYTLRLLTLQQFQRATLLVMALELMRRWDIYNLGSGEPIFIGLWVGDNSLPNRMSPNSDTDKNNLLSEFQKLSDGNKSKVPYDNCPWCRSKLSPSLVVNNEATNTFYYHRLFLKCSNDKCSFSYSRPARARKDQGPIPVSLCDEEIYQHPPALLFGTVDKFAQLAHKVNGDKNQGHRDSRRIFGVGNWEVGKPGNGYLTPDLIIQDELHLLLGPLGSSVALFESAIDQLCTRKDGTRPKVISSTATTRNTDLQIMALFGREVNLFPKPGIECDDSFFAFYRRTYASDEQATGFYLSKRKYIGLLPTGRTQIWMQMRLAAILLTHRALFEIVQLRGQSPLDAASYQRFSEAMDYYHTVLSYFNSLKEVGKTESQIHTYILKEIRRVFNRVIRPQGLVHALYTYSIRKGELTGRLSGEEVKIELEKVQSKWNGVKRFAHVEDEGIVQGNTPPDFVVATNMISVGIDVSRFNSIIMNSMPRNIAEYIQASSRVARDSFGLVLTVHHPFRARDMSHYEKFIEFHEKMYSYVEPISITPFTKKAVDRYLGLYLATMVRHKTPFTNRDSAAMISPYDERRINELVSLLTDYFEVRRVALNESMVDEQVKNLLKPENITIIKGWIRDALNEWKDYEHTTSDNNKVLVFSNKSNKVKPPNREQEQLYVAIEEYEGNIHSDKWQVPMSLRVIEPEASIKIKQK